MQERVPRLWTTASRPQAARSVPALGLEDGAHRLRRRRGLPEPTDLNRQRPGFLSRALGVVVLLTAIGNLAQAQPPEPPPRGQGALHAALASAEQSIQDCYSAEDAEHGGHGAQRWEMVFGRTGAVLDLRVLHDDLGSERLRHCVGSILEGLSVRDTGSQPLEFTVRFAPPAQNPLRLGPLRIPFRVAPSAALVHEPGPGSLDTYAVLAERQSRVVFAAPLRAREELHSLVQRFREEYTTEAPIEEVRVGERRLRMRRFRRVRHDGQFEYAALAVVRQGSTVAMFLVTGPQDGSEKLRRWLSASLP